VHEAVTDAPKEAVPDSGAIIAATKLHVPVPRRGLVPRDGLIDALTADSARKLTLVAAPPGFGKTTLLVEWNACEREERPFAWLSLDPADNDPVRFWGGVIQALRTVEPGVGAAALATLRARNVSLVEVVLPLLLNDLAALGRRLVLVLDDLHLVGEPRIHESLDFFVAQLPASLHLALATRADPPLPLARYRARGEMTEVRAVQLRFSDAETRALLNGILRLGLEVDDVARLQRRTEGWAAGLYLAALSLRGREDARDFIESFAGDDRQIVDYLSSEVLAGQPAELRDFLVRTSILERFCGPLCDAVTGGAGAARVLEAVERKNLFLVPLDRTRHWYRYHHLFGELLRHELQRTAPESVPELHRRAHDWFRARGLVPEAIQHATAAGDVDGARELTALHWNDAFNQGRLDTVAGWLDALPEEAVRADHRLCEAGAWLALDRGRMADAERWIERAEAGSAAEAGSGAEAAVLRAVHSFKAGDLGRAQRAARRVLQLEPEGPSFARFVAHCILGVTQYWGGAPTEARATLAAAAELAGATENDLGQSYVLGYLGLLEVDRGDLDQGDRLGREATELSDDPGFVEHFVTMMGHLARGRVEERRGRLLEAERELARALELARRGAGAVELAAALLALARVRQSRGERAEARALLAEGREALAGAEDAGTLERALSAAERAMRPAPRAPDRGDELTERELSVLRMLAGELSRREIADALFVSLDTVKTHTRGIYRKLGASSREEAVGRGRELGLL
jgi:LuxR family transcriptional regulator, maltose regulon positive regulatory protein